MLGSVFILNRRLAMSVQQTIENLLKEQLSPLHLEVINESASHAGHAHGATDSHFRVVVASPEFEGLRQVARHKKIYSVLAELMDNPVHALAINSFSSDEWLTKQG